MNRIDYIFPIAWFIILLIAIVVGCYNKNQQLQQNKHQLVTHITYSMDGSNWYDFGLTNLPMISSTDVMIQIEYLQVTNNFILIGGYNQ